MNATTQLALNGGNIYAINWKDVGTAALTSGATYGKGTVFTIGLGTASGASGNAVNGVDPILGAINGFTGTILGKGTSTLISKTIKYTSQNYNEIIGEIGGDVTTEIFGQSFSNIEFKEKQ